MRQAAGASAEGVPWLCRRRDAHQTWSTRLATGRGAGGRQAPPTATKATGASSHLRCRRPRLVVEVELEKRHHQLCNLQEKYKMGLDRVGRVQAQA